MYIFQFISLFQADGTPSPPYTMLWRRMNMSLNMCYKICALAYICCHFPVAIQHCIWGEGRRLVGKMIELFQHFWRALKFFFERSWPETCPKHLKWCCWDKLMNFRLFPAKTIFLFFMIFLFFFAYPGSEIFVKIDKVIFCEIFAWNLSKTSQMVLLT